MTDTTGTSSTHDRAETTIFSRREFAATSLAAISMLAVGHPVLEAMRRAVKDGKITAELVSEHVETFSDGARTIMVVEWAGLEGYRGKQTTTVTKRATPEGEVIEYEMSFVPPLLAPRANKSVDTLHARYEFKHGEVTGDTREDTMTVSGVVGTDVLKPVTHRVRRPIQPSAATAKPSADLLKDGLEMINQHGPGRPWPRIEGTNEVLDWRPGERPDT